MIRSLQGLRVIAMFIIFMFHAGFVPVGFFPVTFFFILSGFVIYYSYHNRYNNFKIKESFQFMIKKIKKCYSTHLITFLASIIFKYSLLAEYPLIAVVFMAISNLMLLQSWVPISRVFLSFNDASWYLSSLAFCYLVSNLYIYIINRIKHNNTILCLLLIYVFQVVIVFCCSGLPYSSHHWLFYISPIFRSVDFFIGMLVARIFIHQKSNNKTTRDYYKYIEVLLPVAFIFIYVGSWFMPEAFIWGVYFSPIMIVAIYVYSFEIGKLSKLLSAKFLISLATVSFEFYMIHQLVIIATGYLIKQKILSTLISLVISLFLAKVLNSFNKRLGKVGIRKQKTIWLKKIASL